MFKMKIVLCCRKQKESRQCSKREPADGEMEHDDGNEDQKEREEAANHNRKRSNEDDINYVNEQ